MSYANGVSMSFGENSRAWPNSLSATRAGTFLNKSYTYDDYGPAYMYGVDNYSRYQGRKFEDVEAELGRDWQRAKGKSRLAWEDAKHATKDAFHRASDAVERAVPGDSDRDGK